MMKIPTKKSTVEKEQFIKSANNGNPSVEDQEKTKAKRKYSYANTTLNLTSNQVKLLNDVLSQSKLDSVAHLLYTSISFAEVDPFKVTDFSSYIPLLVEKSNNIKKVTYRKQGVYDILKDKSEHYKATWINMPIKGVVLMYLLNYAKKKLGMDIERYRL